MLGWQPELGDECPMPSFDEWFQRATGHKPYPFQVRFACEPELLSNPSPAPAGRGQGEGLLVDVPTGLGLARGRSRRAAFKESPYG